MVGRGRPALSSTRDTLSAGDSRTLSKSTGHRFKGRDAQETNRRSRVRARTKSGRKKDRVLSQEADRARGRLFAAPLLLTAMSAISARAARARPCASVSPRCRELCLRACFALDNCANASPPALRVSLPSSLRRARSWTLAIPARYPAISRSAPPHSAERGGDTQPPSVPEPPAHATRAGRGVLDESLVDAGHAYPSGKYSPRILRPRSDFTNLPAAAELLARGVLAVPV